ncbi:MAG: hypothetical protein KIT39_09790 [Nitrospirales bacterium]|nr:hypothetical protein [Nitrospirales bacterium]
MSIRVHYLGRDRLIILRSLETVAQRGSSRPSLPEPAQWLGPPSPYWQGWVAGGLSFSPRSIDVYLGKFHWD